MDERVKTMQRLVWESFSTRHNAKREELEHSPQLKAAWNEWQIAWCAAIEAHTATYLGTGRES